MQYIIQERGVSTRHSISHPFSITSEKDGKRIVFGNYTKTDTNGNPISQTSFLGKFKKEEFIENKEEGISVDEIIDTFDQVPEQEAENHFKRFAESKDSLLFNFNQSKSDFFNAMKIKGLEQEEMRLHCFGDIFEFHYHWLESQDMINTMKRCVDKRHPTNRSGEPMPYTCMESFFKEEKEEKEVHNYMVKAREAYFDAVSRTSGKSEEKIAEEVNRTLLKIAEIYVDEHPELVSDHDLSMNFESLRDREVVVENLRRLFCLGCIIDGNKTPTPSYALTVIDSSSNQVRIWLTNRIVLEKIKEEYNEMGGDEKYGKIEHFLTLHDLLIKRHSKNELSIQIVPTIFEDLQGTIIAPNPRYMVMSATIDWLGFINKFNDNLSHYFNLKNVYHPINIIHCQEGKITFRLLDRSEPYQVIDYKPFEYEEESDFDPQFLEI